MEERAVSALPAPPVSPAAVAGVDAAIRQIIAGLARAQLALEVQCARVSVAYFFPGLRELPGLQEAHKENYEVSYHLITAMGAARAIAGGERLPGYYGLLLSCQKEASEHQEKVLQAWGRMQRAAPQRLQAAVQHLGGVLQATARATGQVQAFTRQAYGAEVADALLVWVERAHHS